MLEEVRVNMPSKGCVINKSNKKKIPYVYYAVNYYRNDKGISITDRVLIGKLDDHNMLIPNDNYYKMFKCKIKIYNEEGDIIYDSTKK